MLTLAVCAKYVAIDSCQDIIMIALACFHDVKPLVKSSLKNDD